MQRAGRMARAAALLATLHSVACSSASAPILGHGTERPLHPLQPVAATEQLVPEEEEDTAVFQHGVASGDPQHDRVILWTRVSGAVADAGPVAVAWAVGPAAQLGAGVPERSGVFTTAAARDWTVKVCRGYLYTCMSYNYSSVLSVSNHY